MAEVYNEMVRSTGNKNAIKTRQLLSVYPLRDCDSKLSVSFMTITSLK